MTHFCSIQALFFGANIASIKSPTPVRTSSSSTLSQTIQELRPSRYGHSLYEISVKTYSSFGGASNIPLAQQYHPEPQHNPAFLCPQTPTTSSCKRASVWPISGGITGNFACIIIQLQLQPQSPVWVLSSYATDSLTFELEFIDATGATVFEENFRPAALCLL
jgi:hypothetical protein